MVNSICVERDDITLQERKFAAEIAPVKVKSRKGETVVAEDEEYKKVDFGKLGQLRAVFQKGNGAFWTRTQTQVNMLNCVSRKWHSDGGQCVDAQ